MSTTATSAKPEDKKNVFESKPKPKNELSPQMKQFILETEAIGHDFGYERTPQIPPSFEASEPRVTPVPDVFKSGLSGTISFINPKESLGEITQGAVSLGTDALTSIGGVTQEVWGAGSDIAKMFFAKPPEINTKKAQEDNKKKQEALAKFSHTRAFLEDLTAKQGHVRMQDKVAEALRIAGAPNVTEEDAKMLGLQANVDTADHLMNKYGLNSLQQKKSALQVAQTRQVQKMKMAESKSAVHHAAAAEGGTGKGSKNTSAVNAGG